ncbi:ribonuclease domain-containing protein [Calycomorphotria hydatis]|uniref:Guanyl-specific ribonuclease Sa n=1 Tax=Calycomorphotria hydatis TaxID=2528027 RepID=A0A517TDK1_9PLAN|nr:ribonuclease domain-containing protein [Calycomorphotria hydatis]QDT66453.1 Guanyl-specific ribonuclease Sa [Calycomorphotria hydatis]
MNLVASLRNQPGRCLSRLLFSFWVWGVFIGCAQAEQPAVAVPEDSSNVATEEKSTTDSTPKAFLSKEETLVLYEAEVDRQTWTVTAIVPKTQLVVRADGGGLTLGGQLNEGEIVRLKCGARGEIYARENPAKPVGKIFIPTGTVRVLAAADDGNRSVLLRLSDSRVVRAPPERAFPLPGELGTRVASKIEPGVLIAERAGGDLASDCFPLILTPPTEVQNAVVKNFDRVVFTGTMDLEETLARIALKKRFPHNNDGSVFGNHERRLPNQPRGYYKEYVHPTEGVRGPGPQRLVLGKRGDIWYTGDHYDSFQKILGP